MRTVIRYNDLTDNSIIGSSKDTVKYFQESFRRKNHEEVWILYLDAAHHPIVKKLSTIGSVNKALFDVRDIVRTALIYNSTAIVIAHNHPSNNTNPSANDIAETERLRKACELFEITLCDHLIFGADNYFSFCEEEKHNLE